MFLLMNGDLLCYPMLYIYCAPELRSAPA